MKREINTIELAKALLSKKALVRRAAYTVYLDRKEALERLERIKNLKRVK